VTADVWAELAPGILADQIAGEQRDLVRAYEDARPRSLQQAIGPSGIGSPCSRCLAREVLGCPVEGDFDDPWMRIVGTATHAWLAEARLHRNKQLNRGRYHLETRVMPDGPDSELLPSGGDLDFYDADTYTVVDDKVVGLPKIKKVREHGPGDQYRRQIHLYGRGLALAGYRVDNVAIAFWNRNGFLHDLYVWVEPYDEAVALEALDRYRTIRDLATTHGVAILPHLPADADCWDCKGRPMTEETK
jgi:hypothetical protein